MEQQIKMFKWETNAMYKYRINISEIGLNVGNLLNKIYSFKGHDKEKYKIYIEAKKTITIEYTKLFNLSVPLVYAEIDKYLRESHLYYLKAFDILVEVYSNFNNLKDKKYLGPINKAGTLIVVGNSFITIISAKCFELVEKQQSEYNKDKKNINNNGKSNDSNLVLIENSNMSIDKGVIN